MPGVRRSGVTVAVRALANDASIVQERGSITILDRETLQRHACECYRISQKSG